MAGASLPQPYEPPTQTMENVALPAGLGPTRLDRAGSLDLISRLKATLVAGSLIAFGAFAALAATHVTGVTARSSAAPSTNGSTTAPATTPTASGAFFNQGPSGGFGVGAPGSQGPVSGTSVS